MQIETIINLKQEIIQFSDINNISSWNNSIEKPILDSNILRYESNLNKMYLNQKSFPLNNLFKSQNQIQIIVFNKTQYEHSLSSNSVNQRQDESFKNK